MEEPVLILSTCERGGSETVTSVQISSHPKTSRKVAACLKSACCAPTAQIIYTTKGAETIQSLRYQFHCNKSHRRISDNAFGCRNHDHSMERAGVLVRVIHPSPQQFVATFEVRGHMIRL